MPGAVAFSHLDWYSLWVGGGRGRLSFREMPPLPPPSGTIDQATLSAFQQVFSRISAGAGRIDLPGTALNQRILVQRETRLSLLIILYSKREIHPVRPVSGSPGVCVCAKPGML